MDTEKFVALGQRIAAAVNVMSDSDKERGAAIALGIRHSHRTLQQATIGTLIHTLLALGELDNSWTDPRNEASFHACRQIKQLADDDKIDIYFPLI